ncbi:MAG TPA: AAA family ATPase [Candidatus Dormibacteraeota bacterium]|nr:AAA family ATPase [Candidatus Dormibacteraeota bacterium]
MKCPRCQQDNPAHARFCLGCGSRLALACGGCGAELPGNARFCLQCGQAVATFTAADRSAPPETYTPRHLAERILTSKSALEGERKQVTVLFADLKGSMELLADRDPEEARKIIDPVLELMMEAVHRYEGTVNQVMGDGIMALFGAPLAHEDHATRACYAALRMQNAVAHYAEDIRKRHGVDVQIRVGLNSGDVVVRSIGNDLHMDYTAVGQTTHLAARMEQLARPGTTLITETTLRRAEGFVQVKPLGPTPIKGLAEPVPVYEVVGAGTARTRLQASMARGLTRFVGRDAEVDQLRQALEQAGSGRGQIVAVVGEPGVGKSRLFYEFIHSHRTEGWLVLESSSVSYGKATPYLPMVDLLKSYFKIAEQDDMRAVRAKVTGNVLTLDEGLKDSVAPLLWVLDALPKDHEFTGLDAVTRRTRTLEAVKRVLLRESRTQPLLLVFEDLHWIDAETQALLDALVESLPTTSILLAVNYRPEYQQPWGNKSYYRQLRIDSLPPDTAGALLETLLGDHPALQSIRRLLIERTEGNPLFLEESVRALVEMEVLVGERGAYRLGKDPVAIQIPATVQAILAARIDRLPADDKRLLQVASVIGKDLPWTLLLETAEHAEDALRGGLARLQAAEFVYEAKLFPDLEYTFKHALTHEVAYGSLLHDRRRALHAQIVGAIERVYADRLSEHADRLAHHAFRGEMWEKALHYLREMGSVSKPSIDAAGALGGAESPGHLWFRGEYDRALSLALRERTFSASFGNFGWAILSNLRLGQIYHSLGDYPKATDALTRNVTLLEGDLKRQAFELAGLPSVLSRVWLALCAAECGNAREAAALTEEATAIAEAEDHAYSLVIAHAGTGMLRNVGGNHEGAIGPLERGLVIARLADIPLLFPLIAAPLGRAYALTGRTEEGLRLLEDAVQRAEDMQWAANHPLRLVWLGETYVLTGDGSAGRRLGARALELARRLGERGHEAYALRLLGQIAASGTEPDLEQANTYYLEGLTLAKTLGMQPLAVVLASSLPSPR